MRCHNYAHLNASWATPNFPITSRPVPMAPTTCSFLHCSRPRCSMQPLFNHSSLEIRCMCVDFRAPRHLFAPRRVLATWAVLLLRHPSLSARVIPPPSNGSPFRTDYSAAKFSYTAPASPADAIRKASTLVKFQRDVPRDGVFDTYLNGKRILGENRLSYMIFTENPSDTDDHAEYILFICSTHFIGDSVGYHKLANEFLTIIAGNKKGSISTTTDLEDLVRKEWQARWGSGSTAVVLPPPVEDSLPPVGNKLKKAIGTVNFLNSAREQIVSLSHCFVLPSDAHCPSGWPCFPANHRLEAQGDRANLHVRRVHVPDSPAQVQVTRSLGLQRAFCTLCSRLVPYTTSTRDGTASGSADVRAPASPINGHLTDGY